MRSSAQQALLTGQASDKRTSIGAACQPDKAETDKRAAARWRLSGGPIAILAIAILLALIGIMAFGLQLEPAPLENSKPGVALDLPDN